MQTQEGFVVNAPPIAWALDNRGDAVMQRSTTTARIITALIGVIVTPIALRLISGGGLKIYQIINMFGYTPVDLGELVGPVTLQLVGLVLLVAVVATGLWSSAGLIAAGVLALVALSFALAPGLLLELYHVLPAFIPHEWLDGIFYGLPLAVYAVLGAMGLTLMMVRRSTRDVGGGVAVGGLFAAPVLLAIGGWLLVWGISEGQMQAVVNFDTSFNPLIALVVIASVAFTVAGIGVSRWSPWALVIPALVLLVISLVYVLTMSVPEFRSLIPFDLLRIAMPFVIVGGAVAVAVPQLTFTAVLVISRRRARQTAASVPASEYGAYPVGQYPPPPPAANPSVPPAPPAT